MRRPCRSLSPPPPTICMCGYFFKKLLYIYFSPFCLIGLFAGSQNSRLFFSFGFDWFSRTLSRSPNISALLFLLSLPQEIKRDKWRGSGLGFFGANKQICFFQVFSASPPKTTRELFFCVLYVCMCVRVLKKSFLFFSFLLTALSADAKTAQILSSWCEFELPRNFSL